MSTLRESWDRRRIEALHTDLLPGWYATRRRRRLLASAGLVSIALMWVNGALFWAPKGDVGPTIVYFTLLAISLVLYFPAVTLLNVATRGLTELAERHLDERQLGERLRAVALAHRAMTGLIVVLAVTVLALNVANDRHFSMPGSALFQLTIALALTNFVLPLIVSAWRLPDPPPDEEENGPIGEGQRIEGKTAT
ncbi:hypothetical protein [Streptosporangium carneum]|uniref:Uncharacterized protein n=1 Tax=Streptosporangium carneum TaxID=47481 RepID=A0A9W6I5L7_9ACTN|nr:hypothetical protein [Streptosporangium carneum]GLK12123.1 hypothetical protein GCM10017600_55310 [Streptosporangium carneum]